MITTENSLPLHLVISERLRDQIFNGRYGAGEQLPSEHQLMDQFEVSRITVRRAIANLVQQGLVESQRGRGVFVKAQHKVTRSLSNPLIFFDEDMQRQGVQASIRSLSFERVRASAAVSDQLKLASFDSVYCQKKVILTDGVPVAMDITYIRVDIGQAFSRELQSSLIYPTLDKNGVSIERVEATLECTHATIELSEALEIPLGAPLLVNCYTAFTAQNQPIICGETLSRGDRMTYSVVLTKDNLISQKE
ncbi:MAG: GntR family transcriptional regulator [Cyanobacteria bacterium Co-bin8]|nr:GntR family transcriptional regulator [Cyanobacteria bacterium Co-bin8]